MEQNAAKLLQRLFDGEGDSMGYEINQALSWPPWFPMAAEVWASPHPTSTWHGPPNAWPEARARLEALHAEYLAQR